MPGGAVSARSAMLYYARDVIMNDENGRLSREITWLQGTAMTIGAVIGAGILVLPALAAEAAAFVSVYVIRSSPAWLIVPAAIVSAAGRALEFGAHSSAVSALSPKLAKSWTRVQAAFCVAMAAVWLALMLPGTLFSVILGLAAAVALVLVCAAAAMYLRFSYKLFDSAAE